MQSILISCVNCSVNKTILKHIAFVSLNWVQTLCSDFNMYLTPSTYTILFVNRLQLYKIKMYCANKNCSLPFLLEINEQIGQCLHYIAYRKIMGLQIDKQDSFE